MTNLSIDFAHTGIKIYDGNNFFFKEYKEPILSNSNMYKILNSTNNFKEFADNYKIELLKREKEIIDILNEYNFDKSKKYFIKFVVPRYLKNNDYIEIGNFLKKLDINYNFINVAQAQGAWVKYVIKDTQMSSQALANSGLRAIVDFGYNRTQIMFFNNGSEDKDKFFVENFGIENLLFNISKEILNQLNEELNFSQIKNILKKYVIRDDKVDKYRDIIKDEIVNFMNSLYNYYFNEEAINNLYNSTVVVLSGGGTNIINSDIFKEYINIPFVTKLDNPEFADVEGAYYSDIYMDIFLNT